MKEKETQRSDKEKIIIAFLAGGVIALCIGIYGIQLLAENINHLIAVFVSSFLIITLFIVIFLFFKERVFKNIFGVSSSTLEQIKDSIFLTHESFQKQDIEEGKEKLKHTIDLLSAWYGWISLRRWIVITLSSFLLGFATLLGSALLYNQNQLIENQNRAIDSQTKLIENQNDRIVQQTYLMDSEMKKQQFPV